MNGSDTPDEPPKPSFAPWDDPDYPWDERPMPPAERPQEEDGRVSKNDNRPVVVELVFALKKWEVVAHDGKETFKITGNIEMYWTDDRVIGFPTARKPMPENMWRPRLTGCAGFDLGKAEIYEQIHRVYCFDSCQEHKPSYGRMEETFHVNLAKHAVILCLTQDEAVSYGTMLVEQCSGTWLELLWTYLFSTNSFWNDH